MFRGVGWGANLEYELSDCMSCEEGRCGSLICLNEAGDKGLCKLFLTSEPMGDRGSSPDAPLGGLGVVLPLEGT